MRAAANMAIGAILLAACAGTPDRPAQAPDVPPAPAEDRAALAGTELEAGLVLRDARASGGHLVLDMRATDASAIATPAGREAFRARFEDDFARQVCAAPTLRAFVSGQGGVRAHVADPDGSTIAMRSIDAC